MNNNEKTKSEFEEWNRQKISIDIKNKRAFFHEREVWWCSCGKNIGYEQNGKGRNRTRPILIFKKFNNDMLWALPITSAQKVGKFYEEILFGNYKPQTVILSQLKLMDAKRLVSKLGTTSSEIFMKIKKSVIRLCEE